MENKTANHAYRVRGGSRIWGGSVVGVSKWLLGGSGREGLCRISKKAQSVWKNMLRILVITEEEKKREMLGHIRSYRNNPSAFIQ